MKDRTPNTNSNTPKTVRPFILGSSRSQTTTEELDATLSIIRGFAFLSKLLPVGRSACGEFAQSRQKACGGVRIGQRIKGKGGRELWRLWTKEHLQHVLLADRHQRVEFRRGVFFPMSSCRKHDGTGLVHIPFALIVLAGSCTVAVSAPAMAHYFKVEAGRAAEVSFEGQGFLLFVQAAEEPLERYRARPKFHRDQGIVKASRGEMKASTEAGTVKPAGVEDSSFAGAGRLHPAQGFSALTAVVSGEQDIPHREAGNHENNVNG